MVKKGRLSDQGLPIKVASEVVESLSFEIIMHFFLNLNSNY